MDNFINGSKINAFLHDELSAQENRLVQNYLTEHLDDPEIRTQLKDWFNNCRVESDRTTKDAFISVYSRLGNKRSQFKTNLLPVIAFATMLIAIVVSLKLEHDLHKKTAPVAWNELYVPTSETRELDLPDGTHLKLSAESRVTWPSEFRGSERSIFFEGEVNAVVAKNPDVPFIIHTGGIDVCVHGTTFNFKSYRQDTMVEMMLLEGSVSLNLPTEESIRVISLSPGDIVQYNKKDGDVRLEKMSVDDMSVFSSNQVFSFFNEPLSDIVAQLERAFGTRIVLDEPKLASRRFLAVFKNNETLDQILDLLSVSGGFRVTRKEGVVFLN